MQHYFELGQKIRIDNIGIFKVGVSSSPSDTLAACTAANVKNRRIVFSPETTATSTGKESCFFTINLIILLFLSFRLLTMG